MPGNLIPAQPSQVMPFALCSAFTEELRIQSHVNSYPDGSSDRAALALNARRFFRLTQKLTPTQWNALRAFYFANKHTAFYFYNYRETVPPFYWDPTGTQTLGRYIVVFDGGFSDAVGMGRSEASFQLREVS
jgi:hypothetical protein